MNDQGVVIPTGHGSYRCETIICNMRGLHARAAARLAKLASGFDAEILVAKGGQSVSASSVMGMLMLAAGPGSRIIITASGREAAEAVRVLCDIVQAKFEEED